ncbi:MAG: helix-turn-helix transcriptional regulator [Spirochaetia bacterium]|nr:helix-turn-helix transcriptional regulator [Spirochaetia bacterium]
MDSNFRKNLRDLLDYECISVKELAEMTKIPKRTLENYLGCRASMPPADYAHRIAKALHVTVEYLFSDEEGRVDPSISEYDSLNNVVSQNREYGKVLNELKNLPEANIKMILDIVQAVIKNKKQP